MLTIYRCLLYLYPKLYRRQFADEMCSVFAEVRSDARTRLAVKISFYAREIGGLLFGALREHQRSAIGPSFLFRRFNMQPQFRFPRSTVLLMVVIFTGVLLTIAKATTVELAYGETLGSVWPSLISILICMVVIMFAAAAIGWGILHGLRRSGVHRLADMQTWPEQK
jgi:hypothetical protein